jgi:hypothetical protein
VAALENHWKKYMIMDRSITGIEGYKSVFSVVLLFDGVSLAKVSSTHVNNHLEYLCNRVGMSAGYLIMLSVSTLYSIERYDA